MEINQHDKNRAENRKQIMKLTRKERFELLFGQPKTIMNETDTPETELFEATKVSLDYGNQRLTKKSQSSRLLAEIAFSDGYEYALKHSSKIQKLERERDEARREAEKLKGHWLDDDCPIELGYSKLPWEK